MEASTTSAKGTLADTVRLLREQKESIGKLEQVTMCVGRKIPAGVSPGDFIGRESRGSLTLILSRMVAENLTGTLRDQ